MGSFLFGGRLKAEGFQEIRFQRIRQTFLPVEGVRKVGFQKGEREGGREGGRGRGGKERRERKAGKEARTDGRFDRF